MYLRILSLLPAATEMVYFLGLQKYLVGVSHDCDFPSQVKKVPKITSSSISNAMTSLEIDMAVKKLGHRGPGVFHINQKRLKELKPNLILTQDICPVCAVSYTEVKKAVRILNSHPEFISGSSKEIPKRVRNDDRLTIISLEPESIDDILENILLVGQVTGYRLQAQKVIRKLEKRLDKVAKRLPTTDYRLKRKTVDRRPKALVIEWLDPIMIAGHWVPEMIDKAGGKMLVTKPGERSRQVSLTELEELREVDILIFAPCGFDIKRIIQEKHLINKITEYVLPFSDEKRRKDYSKVYLLDGNSYMTRPGPRIVDGIEILAEILHPEIFPKVHSEKDWQQFMVSSD